MRKQILFSAIVIQLIVTCCYQASAMERFDIITTEELEEMLTLRDQGKIDFILVNTLDEIIFRDASIPGSINIPWSRVNEFIHHAGDDKDKLLIFY